jgi:hypothetical protein
MASSARWGEINDVSGLGASPGGHPAGRPQGRVFGAWVVGPVAARLGALEQSMAKYPNIKPGEEFAGYS